MTPRLVVGFVLGAIIFGSAALGQLVSFTVDPDDNIFPSLVLSCATAAPPDILRLSQEMSLTHSPAGKRRLSLDQALQRVMNLRTTMTKTPLALSAECGGDLLTAKVKAPRAGCQVTVVVDATAYFDESTCTKTLNEADRVYELCPPMRWKYEALRGVTQQTPLSITCRVTIDGGTAQVASRTTTIRAVHDCPLYWRQGSVQSNFNLAWLFAAYVNEDHPWIDRLLREAIDDGVVASFVGEQKGADEALQEVFAVWYALQRRGFTYSSIATPPGENAVVTSQTVRLLDQALATSQGNCIDGTVVFASMLRKIGLEPYIVLVPGHAFLAFELPSKNGPTLLGLETTMVQALDLREKEPGAKRTDQQVALKMLQSASTFQQAVGEGTKRLQAAVNILPIPSSTKDTPTFLTRNELRRVAISRDAVPAFVSDVTLRLPIAAGKRWGAFSDSGWVLQLRNKGLVSMQVRVVQIINGKPTYHQDVSIAGGSTTEIGWMEGLKWASEHQFRIEAQGYQPIEMSIGK